MSKTICIIPARGGSKRIPRKNIRDFYGKPIIAYSIESAKNSNLFNKIMVSTDDEEIANISKKYGADVPFFRSRKNSDDVSGLAEVLIEVIMEYRIRNIFFSDLACILPTAPFITAEKLIIAYNKFDQKNYDSLIPIVMNSYPIQRAFIIKNGNLSMIWPENYNKRSQDFKKTFHDAGQFYFMKADRLLEEKKILLQRTTYLEIPEIEVQDIDNEEDWQLAELKYQLTMKKNKKDV